MNALHALATASLCAGLLLTAGCAPSAADTGRGEERERHHAREGHGVSGWLASLGDDFDDRRRTSAPAHAGYAEECGSCHLAFPPGLLDAAGWERIFADLGNHFGDDASLDPATATNLASFVAGNAGNDVGIRTSDGTPRITTTRWFVREHHELPRDLAATNNEVRSMANCGACHRDAADGGFRERRIVIPGLGRWDD